MDFRTLGHKPMVAAKYPHLAPEDAIIWRRLLGNDDVHFDEVWYDVRVGEAVRVPTGQPEWMQRMSDYSTRKRIDIVARRGWDYWVIEAKPFAGVVALGQAIFYSETFRDEYKIRTPVFAAVITDICDPDVLPIFDRHGVVVFEVGRADGAADVSRLRG